MTMSPQAREHERLVKEIKPYFKGVEPMTVLGVLAELLATFLCGFSKRHRRELLNDIVDLERRLEPMVDQISHGGMGHPEDRH